MLPQIKSNLQKFLLCSIIFSAAIFAGCGSEETDETLDETETIQSMPENMQDTMMMDTTMMDTASTRQVKSPT